MISTGEESFGCDVCDSDERALASAGSGLGAGAVQNLAWTGRVGERIKVILFGDALLMGNHGSPHPGKREAVLLFTTEVRVRLSMEKVHRERECVS